ncbi:MAG: DNA primase regulatory subunit PriL [Methanocellales archaeon]|nr:DNA primase regulatory subunit PriL [Methanocellales archaeon]MDD3290984.1 DNA primase regulatory subunit PriL [Methanocellales archaeon]MDD5234869.1 DNA primase regulatory subunit PriL [Methanocellales archaeon]MDD5484761.1 DNA primase regulatory subunit PriL [Methanocellales archaeon]
MDIDLKYAYYPFTSCASDYVKRSGKSIESLLDGEFGKAVINRAKERVIQAIRGSIKNAFDGKSIPMDVDLEKELFSYPIARIFVSCIGDPYLIKRYALAEAEAAHVHMKAEEPEFLEKLAREFNIQCVLGRHDFQIHFADYLRFASRMHDLEWKLVNRRLENGYVPVNKRDFVRLLQEAIRDRIQSSLPLDLPPALKSSFSPHIADISRHFEELKAEFRSDDFGEVDSECFPPCIKHMLALVQAGQNLAHSARFALTSFLANIGMSAEEIIDIYRVSPDFDEGQTSYQVKHILGSSGKAYTAPNCATMATYGNCFGKERICDWVSHPLSFYRKKLDYDGKARQEESAGASVESTIDE